MRLNHRYGLLAVTFVLAAVSAAVPQMSASAATHPTATARSSPASGAQSLRDERGHITSADCDPRRVFSAPRNFRPAHASAAKLREYGFPARPSGNPVAFKAWTNEMDHFKRLEAPHPVCGHSRDYYTIQYTGTFAGQEVPDSDYNDNSWVGTSATWTQPKVGSNSKYTNFEDAPQAVLWTGIQSADGSSAVQAGCSSIATSTAQYRCWTEDWPTPPVYEGPVISPGDTIAVDVSYSDGTGYYFIEDVTSGTAASFSNPAPHYGGTWAAFTLERYKGYYLPNFGTTTMGPDYFWNSVTGTNYGITAGNNNILTMTSNCKATGTAGTTLLAKPGAIDDSTESFSITTYASSPYSDTCTPTT